MQEQPARVLRGRIIKAAGVFVAFLVVFLVVDRLSGPGEQTAGEAVATTATTTAPEATTEPGTAETPEDTAPETTAPETTAAPETTQPEAEQPPPTTADGQAPDEPEAPRRPADGVTLQILNGTGELRLARDFKPLARQEGYQIVNSGNADGGYPVSTIFYTSGHREDAEAFQARFPAFEVVAPAPDTLSDTVALHAVLGENYEP